MSILFEYVKELFSFTRCKFIVNISLLVVLGMLDGIGILMLLPFLSISGIIPPAATAGTGSLWLAQFFNNLGTSVSLPVILLSYTGIIFLHSWLRRYQSNINMQIQQSFYTFLSVRLFRSLAYSKWSFLITKKKSDITHLITSELARVSYGTQYFLQLAAIVILSAIHITLAFLLSPQLTLLVVTGGMLLFYLMQTFVKKSKTTGLSISNHTRDLFFGLTEHLNGIKEVKSCGMESRQVENFVKLRQTIEQNFIKFNKIQSDTEMLYKVSAAVFISIFFYCANQFFQIKPQEFILLVVIFARLWPRIASFQGGLQHVVMMLPAFRAVIGFEQQCNKEKEVNLEDHHGSKIELKQELVFKQVSFRYQQGNGYALRQVNLAIPAGTTVALVGVSGSGKSTVADLITGMITPAEGDIVLDGTPLNQIQVNLWRRSIGYVAQDAFLFHASILDNLLWAHEKASQEEIWEALSLAAAADLVAGLPQGLNTVIGDRGVRLSGGERQRIVLARALLRKPSVLILDEATSSLDMENEQKIYRAIEGLHGKLTIIIIAHRLATIRKADQILVLEKGQLVEQGNYLDLIENKAGRFHGLAAIN